MRATGRLILGATCAGIALAGCQGGDEPDAGAELSIDLPAMARPMSGSPACPAPGDTTDLPVVTVRGGGAVASGRIQVGSSVFVKDSQVVAEDPGFALAKTSPDTVRLEVSWLPGKRPGDVAGAPPPFKDTISLPRCTEHEGRLVRVHVDGVKLKPGREDPGPPVISVIGIYDALTSEEALKTQAYACVRCGRIEVCGANPPDC